MTDIAFPYNSALLVIRRQQAPTAKWLSVTKTWQMTAVEADRFLAAADKDMKAAGQTLVIRRDLKPITLGVAEGVDDIYESDAAPEDDIELEIDAVDALIAAAAQEADEHADDNQAYFARTAAALKTRRLPSPWARGAIKLCLSILADEGIKEYRCRSLARKQSLSDVEAIVARDLVARCWILLDNETLIAAALDSQMPEDVAPEPGVPEDVAPVIVLAAAKKQRGRPTNASLGRPVLSQSERQRRYRSNVGIVSLDISAACGRRLRAVRTEFGLTTEQLIERALDALAAAKHRKAA